MKKNCSNIFYFLRARIARRDCAQVELKNQLIFLKTGTQILFSWILDLCTSYDSDDYFLVLEGILILLNVGVCLTAKNRIIQRMMSSFGVLIL